MHEFGRLPKRGEIAKIGDFKFKVLRADSRRIYLLQITREAADKGQADTRPADVA
jgi:magnesium and cobalt transporter